MRDWRDRRKTFDLCTSYLQIQIKRDRRGSIIMVRSIATCNIGNYKGVLKALKCGIMCLIVITALNFIFLLGKNCFGWLIVWKEKKKKRNLIGYVQSGAGYDDILIHTHAFLSAIAVTRHCDVHIVWGRVDGGWCTARGSICCLKPANLAKFHHGTSHLYMNSF